MSYVIFTIDFEHNPHRQNIFMNYLAERASEMVGNVIPMLGSYKGVAENSFICRKDDFDKHLRWSVFLSGQESILHVASGNKMEATLEYLADGSMVPLGCMHQVCKEEAMQAEAYSYRPDLDIYWIAKQGNPDNSYADSVAKYRAPSRWECAEPVAAE